MLYNHAVGLNRCLREKHRIRTYAELGLHHLSIAK